MFERLTTIMYFQAYAQHFKLIHKSVRARETSTEVELWRLNKGE
jgi:hypothetical protein